MYALIINLNLYAKCRSRADGGKWKLKDFTARKEKHIKVNEGCFLIATSPMKPCHLPP